MAKWENKDPKWIVQDRQDGSNVNGAANCKSQAHRFVQRRSRHCGHYSEREFAFQSAGWHWEEKNQLGWSKQKLEELLVGLMVDMSAVQGNAKVTALKDLQGEVRRILRAYLSEHSKIACIAARFLQRHHSWQSKQHPWQCLYVMCTLYSPCHHAHASLRFLSKTSSTEHHLLIYYVLCRLC